MFALVVIDYSVQWWLIVVGAPSVITFVSIYICCQSKQSGRGD